MRIKYDYKLLYFLKQLSNMKAVILAGGLGTRISEETHTKPKPMIEIGGKPILWHIMKIYSHYGVNDFIICCGYKGYVIKEYFSSYFLHNSDVTFDMKNNKMHIHSNNSEPWQVTLIDTGLETLTGGRLKRIYRYVKDCEYFHFTYGDGLSNVDIHQLTQHHIKHQRLATLTAIFPPGRFGALELEENRVCSFTEKPKGDGSMVNGGFFVLSPKLINQYIDDDATIWEQEPLINLAKDNELTVYRHDGFWQSMDTLRDKNLLQELWVSDKAPWKL